MKTAKAPDFSKLPPEFVTEVEAMSEVDLRAKASVIALNEVENQQAKKNDEDLKEKKEQAKLAGEAYLEATKANKLKLAFIHQMLADKGKI